jgi:benzoate-CoA ligase
VSPADVEARLIEHPAVLEAAVVGVQVEGFTKAKAYVAARDPRQASPTLADELRDFCAAGLHRYQVPQQIEFVEGLPKTATGKIERYKLRAPA